MHHRIAMIDNRTRFCITYGDRSSEMMHQNNLLIDHFCLQKCCITYGDRSSEMMHHVPCPVLAPSCPFGARHGKYGARILIDNRKRFCITYGDRSSEMMQNRLRLSIIAMRWCNTFVYKSDRSELYSDAKSLAIIDQKICPVLAPTGHGTWCIISDDRSP